MAMDGRHMIVDFRSLKEGEITVPGHVRTLQMHLRLSRGKMNTKSNKWSPPQADRKWPF